MCLYVTGSDRYATIARESALSVLDHSDFDLFCVHDVGRDHWIPRSPRVSRLPLARATSPDRAHPFNGKLDALSQCIERSGDDLFIMLDADAVFIRRIEDTDVRSALGSKGMGMVEQKRTNGPNLARQDLYEHYCQVSLRFAAPDAAPPSMEAFRYFNSGVVLLEPAAAMAALDWTREVTRRPLPHQIGEHMVADQDHLQVWANSITPGCCAELPWYWNHCEHWDDQFPRAEAWIAHFSNFCQGPNRDTARRMRRVRRAAPGGWFRDLWR